MEDLMRLEFRQNAANIGGVRKISLPVQQAFGLVFLLKEELFRKVNSQYDGICFFQQVLTQITPDKTTRTCYQNPAHKVP